MGDDVPMWQYLIWAMEKRGIMRTQDIYHAVKAWCEKMKRPLPPNWQSVIRQTLQAHCRSRPQYKGRADIFEYHGRGYWSCKATSPSIHDLLAQI
jgi:hypothetical protein